MLTDDQTNNVCLVVMEQITAHIPDQAVVAAPNAAMPLIWRVVTLWERETETESSFRITLIIRAPDGGELLRVENTGQFSDPDKRRLRSSVVGDGFPLAGSGRYTFNIETGPIDDAIIVASVPLDLRLSFGDRLVGSPSSST